MEGIGGSVITVGQVPDFMPCGYTNVPDAGWCA